MNKQKVLIISKDLILLKNISQKLKALNIEFTIAEDGLSGLEHARTNEFAYLIVDSELPKCNGFILTRLLIFDSKYKHIKIILTSDDPQDIIPAKQMGAESFILKSEPEQISDYINTIKSRSCQL